MSLGLNPSLEFDRLVMYRFSIYAYVFMSMTAFDQEDPITTDGF